MLSALPPDPQLNPQSDHLSPQCCWRSMGYRMRMLETHRQYDLQSMVQSWSFRSVRPLGYASIDAQVQQPSQDAPVPLYPHRGQKVHEFKKALKIKAFRPCFGWKTRMCRFPDTFIPWCGSCRPGGKRVRVRPEPTGRWMCAWRCPRMTAPGREAVSHDGAGTEDPHRPAVGF